jgi:hypothetical protein
MASFVAVIAEARKGFRGWRPKMSRYRGDDHLAGFGNPRTPAVLPDHVADFRRMSGCVSPFLKVPIKSDRRNRRDS